MRGSTNNQARPRSTWTVTAAIPLALALVHCSLKLSFANVAFGSDGGSIIGEDGGLLSPDGAVPLGDAGGDGNITPTQCQSTPGRGPSMVPVAIPGVPAFCIDTTEVSIAQYKAFLADNNKPAAPTGCVGGDRAPKGGAYLFNLPDLNGPIRYVDWCDAATFCAWAGKRLCGKPGGGPSDIDDHEDVSVSQWYAGCTQKEEDFPYGNSFVEGKCNVDKSGDECEVAPSLFPGCHGAITSLLGMSGNVKEWEDSCDGDNCRVRGGSCYNKHAQATCGADETRKREDAKNLSDVGFRCCSL